MSLFGLASITLCMCCTWHFVLFYPLILLQLSFSNIQSAIGLLPRSLLPITTLFLPTFQLFQFIFPFHLREVFYKLPFDLCIAYFDSPTGIFSLLCNSKAKNYSYSNTWHSFYLKLHFTTELALCFQSSNFNFFHFYPWTNFDTCTLFKFNLHFVLLQFGFVAMEQPPGLYCFRILVIIVPTLVLGFIAIAFPHPIHPSESTNRV